VTGLPRSVDVLVVGGGVNGLSTAYHLADELDARGRGGARIAVLERRSLGAGASGISGGIVRNFYLSPSMNEVVRRSVEIFELDPAGFGYRPVGYAAAVRAEQVADLELIAEQHRAVGYRSELVVGEEASLRHLREVFADWRGAGVAGVLHERMGGFADPMAVVRNLAGMARSLGVEIHEGVSVEGFELAGGSVSRVETSAGPVDCELVVVAPGPWAEEMWTMLGLPLDVRVDGQTRRMFHYLKIQEGDFDLPEGARLSGAVRRPPVVHFDSSQPLVSERDGSVIHPGPWGVYFRTGREGGIQGGGLPVELGSAVEVDPYGPSSPDYGSPEPWFDDFFTSALGTVLGRFHGRAADWRSSSYAAVGVFTPDSYPVADFVLPNVYAILDSTHAFKMLALGKLAARAILGDDEPALHAFGLGRFGAGLLHPVSQSPYPWT
jgi:glycine/D-amino acid oxidase-like deaminating enzyme